VNILENTLHLLQGEGYYQLIGTAWVEKRKRESEGLKEMRKGKNEKVKRENKE
jgi:hypothetical protein